MQGILGAEKGSELLWTASSREDPEMLEVHLGMAHFGTYRRDDIKARNVLVGLIGATSIRRTVIAEAFGINRCLVVRYTKQMQRGGVGCVVRDGRGRKGKVTEEIREFVEKEFRKLYGRSRKNFTGKLIKRVKVKFGVQLSRELIRQIIKPVREEIRQGVRSKKRVSGNLPVLRGASLPVVYGDFEGNGGGLIRRLEVGFYSRYAGGLLLNVFIARLTEGVFEDSGGSGKEQYGLKSFALMVMQMVHFDIVNIERVKRLYRGEFGLLLGKEKSPTLATMRRKLGALIGRVDTDRAMMQLARNYIDNLAPEGSTYYIDDHFDPYWGKAEVLKGFSNVYDRAMEGTEHCFVHDAAGNPVFFGLRDCYHSFNQVLPYVAGKLKGLLGEGRRLRLVFDRGGYDRKVFGKLGGMGIYYSVWAKGDRSDYRSMELEYEEEEFLFRRNEPGKPRRVRIGIAEVPFVKGGRGGPKRKIILRRKAGRRLGKRQEYMYSAFVTNDEEASRRELTEGMILRWRQECDFKSESGEFGIDQITTYMMKGYSEGAHEDVRDIPREEVEGKLVDNPALKPLRREKRRIRAEISKIDGELGKRVFADYEGDLRTVVEVSLKRGNAKLLRRRKELVRKLDNIESQMKALPKRVKLLEVLKEKEVMRFDFRGKLLVDTLKVAARNVRRMALGVLDGRYGNYRDQVDFLRRLIRSGGHVKLGRNGKIEVTLSAMNTDWENKVADAFLEEINKLQPELLGAVPMSLKFRLEG